MSGKKLRIGLGAAGFLGVAYFFGPALLILTFSLFGGIQSQLSSHSIDIGSGQQIHVKKTVTPYQDWNTGSPSERTEYTLFYKGSKVGFADLQKWLGVKDSDSAEAPTIYDAIELQADDILLMLAKNSQGNSYPLLRIHLDANTSALQTDVIKLDGEESQYNWFPDSRLPGWARAVSVSGTQFMLRFSPFKVVPLGHGELAKVEFPFAFLASDEQKSPEIVFRVVDLNDGKISSALKLDKDCFGMPEFSFDHPKLDAFDTAENDQNVKYNYGPKWWNKNIEWTPQASALKLKVDHTLVAPAAKVFSIQHEVPKPVVPASPATNEPMAEPAPLFNESEIDQVPVIIKNCAQKNPNGFKNAQSMSARVEHVDVAAFCLQPDWPVDSALRNTLCGVPTRKNIFIKDGVALNEVSFLYRPMDRKVKPIQIVVPEVEAKGKKFISLKDPGTDEVQSIKESFVLNENQILLKARSEGPWLVYLLSIEEKDFSLEKVGLYAYPSGPFVNMGGDGFLYDKKSAVLIRKKPFGYLDRLTGLLAIQDKSAVAAYVDKDKMYVRVLQFTPDVRMEEQSVSKLEVPLSCFAEDDVPQPEMSIAERWQWFDKYFAWTGDKSKVALKAACRKH